MLTESSTNGEIDVPTFYNAIEAIYARCRAGWQDRDGGGGGKCHAVDDGSKRESTPSGWR
jgi:hypothetical protein